jgi:hypothetical protein
MPAMTQLPTTPPPSLLGVHVPPRMPAESSQWKPEAHKGSGTAQPLSMHLRPLPQLGSDWHTNPVRAREQPVATSKRIASGRIRALLA